MYSLIGVSFSFAITFAFIDFINTVTPLVRRIPDAKPVHNIPQVVCILAGSLFVGMTFGFFFGCFDVEDDTTKTHIRLIEDQYTCVPISSVAGFFTGLAVERAGRKQFAWTSEAQYDIVRFDNHGGCPEDMRS